MQTKNKKQLNKTSGRVYTPQYLVGHILDVTGYAGETILRKHIIDNSCGDGAFLTNIATRYCEEALKKDYGVQKLKEELSLYIHGIEIDKQEHQKCIQNLNDTVSRFGIKNVQWDILCADTLEVDCYKEKMDFVVGNPPYVRLHNLENKKSNVRKLVFSQSGMTDLYIAFYELGLQMLKSDGILGYITPSSFFNSVAGQLLRKYIIENNLLESVVNLKHYQPFAVTTYTAIVVLSKKRVKENIQYFEFDEKEKKPFYVDALSKYDYFIRGGFYFSTKEKLRELRNIMYFKKQKEVFSVKNGFATLADKFFIGTFNFSEHIIPIVKASTGKRYQCLFPYKNGCLIPYNELVADLRLKKYYEMFEVDLKKRSLEDTKNWYGFGRSQGISDVGRCKYAINVLIRDVEDIKILKCDEGVGVYSGLYILTSVSENVLREILQTTEFITYISLLGKYKSGGYYTFSSKDLQIYLEYKNAQREIGINERYELFENA